MDERPGPRALKGPTPIERPVGIERPPRPRATSLAAGVGALWGWISYSILWDGTPFAVDRRFVQSAAGVVGLFPARVVLWAVRAAEVAAGTRLEMSRSTWVLGLGAGAAGAATLVLFGLGVRLARSLARR